MTVGTETLPREHRWLLAIPEACAGLGVGRSTLYEMAARGDVQIVRVGRRALVPVASIDAYVERLRAGHGAVSA